MALSWRKAPRPGQLRSRNHRRAVEIIAIRGTGGELRAFYNVCQYRAHGLVEGEGRLNNLVCPYHGWSYDLSGRLQAARRTNYLIDFDTDQICLNPVQITEFGGFVYVNLDPGTAPLAEQAGDLAAEIASWAPGHDVESVQRGMSTPAFQQGRIVNDPGGSDLSEHAVHHFHGLVLDAYKGGVSPCPRPISRPRSATTSPTW